MNIRFKCGKKVHRVEHPDEVYSRFFYETACGKGKFEGGVTITQEEISCKGCLRIMALRELDIAGKW